MDNRQRARELWEQSEGSLPLKDIAKEIGVPASTVRNWKARDGWTGNKATHAVSRTNATRRDTNRKRKAAINRKIAETVEANDGLTDVEKDFCLHFVSCYNATQAAWRTGRYASYNRAKQSGWEMLHRPAVQEEIKRLKLMKRAAILADVDDLIELHMSIAFSDIKDFAVWAYDPELRVNRMAALPSDNVDGRLVLEVSESKQGLKIKMQDKDESLRFLERYFEVNPMDRHKKAFDNARLKLEQEKLEVDNGEALTVLDDILKAISRQANED